MPRVKRSTGYRDPMSLPAAAVVPAAGNSSDRRRGAPPESVTAPTATFSFDPLARTKMSPSLPAFA